MTTEDKYQALKDAIAIAKEYGKLGAERGMDPGYVIEEAYNKIIEIMTKIEKED